MKLLSDNPQTSSDRNALQTRQNLSPSTESRLSELKTKYPDIFRFTEVFHPEKTEKYASFPDRCIMGNAPTLTDLRLTYSGSAHLQWLIAQIATFQEKVSIQNKMSKYEIESCAQTIYDNYHHLKATEIMLFFARLLGGTYPVDWHGYITPTKIVSALREYFMPWRNEVIYRIERQEEQKRREEESKKKGITWEEYQRMKGTDDPNPLTRFDNG